MPEAASRLTGLADLPAPDAAKVAGHSWRKLGDKILLTNDGGHHLVLSADDYRRYLKGAVSAEEDLGKELLSKGFFRDQLDFRALAEASVARNLLEAKGPGVHTVVVTLRCNFKCLYCHASVVGPDRTDMDMTPETAKAVVDMIFQSPNPAIMIEFQGGEPLLNWPVVKFIVEYAHRKNEHHKKALNMGLISNFSLLDDAKIDFLLEKGVSFCTSLDGPAEVHNKNRVYLGGNTHEQVVAALKKIQDRRGADPKIDPPNAICTVTRHSLAYQTEIVDQLVDLGLERIQLGPLDPVGFARKSWDTIGYSSQQFLEFYANALDYIIALNKKGVKVYEKMAMILLVRILEGEQWRFPNADGLSRLAYNFNGDIYTCEDARLLANEGDEFFKIGSAVSSSFLDLMDHPMLKLSALAAGSFSQPMCSQCAYQTVCTVQPVFNHQTQGSVWGQLPGNAWCEKMMGLFDLLYARLQDPETRKILEGWLDYRSR